MKPFLHYVFLFLALGAGLWSVFFPDGVIAFRRRLGWREDIWSGGFFYVTERRARFTGAAVVVLSLLGFFLVPTNSR